MTADPVEHDERVSETAKFVAEVVSRSQNKGRPPQQRKEQTRASSMALHDERSMMRHLLRDYEPDPNAVPIPMPWNVPRDDVKPEMNRPMHRGPKPQNTLSGSHVSSQNQPTPHPPRGGVPPLSVRPESSSALPTKRPLTADLRSQTESKMSKRQCTGTSNSPQVVDITDDADELTDEPQNFISQVNNRFKKTNPFAESVTRAMPTFISGITNGISEFTRVENRVCSKLYAKYKAVGELGPETSAHFHVSVPYKGTARPSQRGKQGPTTSSHWPLQSSHKGVSLTGFIDENGRRRGASDSEDELVAKGPSDQYQSVQRSTSPSKSSSKAVVIFDSQEDLQPMEFERSIPATKFSNVSESKKRLLAKKKPRGSPFNKPPFSISRIVSESFCCIDKPSQMIFKSTAADDDYFEISGQDANFPTVRAGLKIPARLINSIVWCSGSPIVHLKCSKSFDQKNLNIDIDFVDAETCGAFAAILSARGKVDVRSTDRQVPQVTLTKIFETSLKNRREFATRPVVGNETPDLDLIQRRRDRNTQDQSPEQAHSSVAKHVNIKDRLISMASRIAQKDSSAKSSSDRAPNFEPTENKQQLQEMEPSSSPLRNWGTEKSDKTDEAPLTRSTRRTLPKTRKQSSQSFFVPEEPPQQLGYSKTHGLGDPWKKPLVYPFEGKKKSTVEWSDLEKLDESEYLNDNLLGFYLRFLEDRLEQERPDIAKTVYWFNTYFFTSLTQNVRGKGKINYDAVRKWTRSVDLFNFDYVVVPINENHHWYLAIICNLPALKRVPMPLTDDDDDMLDKGNTMESDNAEEVDQRDVHDPIADVSFDNEEELPRREADPNEQLARESFAEMQIDEAKRKPSSRVDDANIEEIRAVAQDGKEDISQAEVLEIIKTEEAKGDGPLEIVGKKVEVSPKVSKGKRKQKFDFNLPIIMTLDSLGLSHPVTIKILKTYLQEEAKDKRGGMTWDDKAIRGMTAQEIPHQQNYWDCGLFVLGYASKFRGNPREFLVKMCSREYNDVEDWPSMNPSFMRSSTRDLIFGLHRKQHPDFYRTAGASPRVGLNPTTQQDAPSHIPPRQADEEAFKQKASEKPDPKDQGHLKEMIKASPEPATTPKVHKGEAASQAISIDDPVIEVVEPERVEKPEKATPLKVPGAFTDGADDSDDQAVMIPDSQEG